MTDVNLTLVKELPTTPFHLVDLLGKQLPTRKSEDWKYNDVFFLKNEIFQINEPSQLKNDEIDLDAIDLEEIRTNIQSHPLINHDYLAELNLLVFIDGNFCEKLSRISEKNKLSITSPEKLTSDHVASIRTIESHYGKEKNPLVSLVNLDLNNSSYIKLEENTLLENPLHILHYVNDATNANETTDNTLLTKNKLVIDLLKGSESTIVESFISASANNDEHAQLALQTTLVNVGENTKADHYRFNLESQSHKQISNISHLLNKNATLNSFFYSNGSLLNKTDVKVINIGCGANSQTTGIYLPYGQQNIDYHTCIEHRVPHCNSREIFRGIIADKAKATFNGKIHIFKDAQKSDAQLSNKNLLLTNTAEINTKPELEIYADDVICAHGATVAKIDESSIFYLKSRGISDSKARAMISVGFINELLTYVKNDSIKNMLTQLIQNRLSLL